MLEWIMDIKCRTNPNYFYSYRLPERYEGMSFKGLGLRANQAEECVDRYIKRPVVTKSATGLLSSIKARFAEYVNNIKHTYDHKIIFAIIEKELYGKNSIDSITHDLDKLILYILGFSKAFVSKFHRMHSEHHFESGKKMNLRSVICDNIASSPDFKPEKQYSLRDYFQIAPDLQQIEGLESRLDKYNYGEDLDFEQIKTKIRKKYHGAKGLANAALKDFMVII